MSGPAVADQSTARLRFRGFRREVLYLIVICFLLGLALLGIPDINKVLDGVIGALAGFFITVAVVELLYEAFLREAFARDGLVLAAQYLKDDFTDDLIASLGVTMKLAAIGVRDVSRTRPFMDDLDATESLGVVLVDSGWWYDEWWPDVLEAARKRKIDIQIYIPDDTQPTNSIASRTTSARAHGCC